jgi:hypothetical protein
MKCSHSTSPERRSRKRAVDYCDGRRRAVMTRVARTKDKNNHNHDEAPSIAMDFQPTRLRTNELRAQTLKR